MESIGDRQEARFKAAQLELRKFRPFQLRQLNSFKCLERIAKESISEHQSARQFLDIPEAAFLRVHKNLETAFSWAQSMSADMESSLTRADSCLSTVSIPLMKEKRLTNILQLSYLFTMKHENSIDLNTQSMDRMAKSANKESESMKEIAHEARRDNRAMKTIAQMTMIYLPASFVAVSDFQKREYQMADLETTDVPQHGPLSLQFW